MTSFLQALFILCLAFIFVAIIELVLERLKVVMLTCDFKLKYSQLRQMIRKGFTRKMKFRQVNRRVRLKRKVVRRRVEITRSMLRYKHPKVLGLAFHLVALYTGKFSTGCCCAVVKNLEQC